VRFKNRCLDTLMCTLSHSLMYLLMYLFCCLNETLTAALRVVFVLTVN